MATEEDICNLALAHLGDVANVVSLNPPEGSAQAGHCARFYPIARDSLLEMHTWGFASRRVTLAALASAWPEWDYAYAKPSSALKVLAILPPDATNDISAPSKIPTNPTLPVMNVYGAYTPQTYIMEVSADGTEIIYTDQPNAVARYIESVTDSSRFTQLFVMALSWHLASMLAGPVLKGDAGATESKRASGVMLSYLAKATAQDANQSRHTTKQNVDWMTAR